MANTALIIATKTAGDVSMEDAKDPEIEIKRQSRILSKASELENDPHFTAWLYDQEKEFKKDDYYRSVYENGSVENLCDRWEGFKKDQVKLVDGIVDQKGFKFIKTPAKPKDAYSIDEIRDMVSAEVKELPVVKGLDFSNMMFAANAVALNYVMSAGAKRMLFGKGTDWKDNESAALRGNLKADENGKYKLEDVNNAIKQMRDNLLNDVNFLKVLSDGGNLSDVYDNYKKAVRKEINDKIKNSEKLEEKSAKKKGALKRADVTVSKEDLDYLKKTYKELQTLYKSEGKYRSEYAKNVATSLENVIKNAAASQDKPGQFIIAGKDMQALQKDAMAYYKKRQGSVFDPVTNRGKARLEVVEKLITKTDKMSEKSNKAPKAAPKI